MGEKQDKKCKKKCGEKQKCSCHCYEPKSVVVKKGKAYNWSDRCSKPKKCKKKCKPKPSPVVSSDEWFYRAFDGIGDNLNNPDWGSAHTALLRSSPWEPFETRTTNPRVISNNLCAGDSPVNPFGLTDMFWGWGQFIDHLLDLTPDDSGISAPIIAPPDDPVLPNGIINFTRSGVIANPGGPPANPNIISSFIDATNVYGTENDRVFFLRLLDGTGKLKTQDYGSGGELLPLNTAGLPNAALPRNVPSEMFIAGDVRANENVLLTSLHTVFVLEHNRQCEVIRAANPKWEHNEGRLFDEARKRVVAHMQAITYQEFLPLLLGSSAIAPYTGYKPDVMPGINQEFSACAYRLGHTMVSGSLQIGIPGSPGATGLNLVEGFFNPDWLKANGLKKLIEGSAVQKMQRIDTKIVPELRSFLFGPHAPGMFLDLAALNMQRGRDHGLTDYNSMREAYGLPRLTSFSQITSDSTIANSLSTTYGGNIDIIDPWIGGLAEDHVGGGQVGPLFRAILIRTFTRLRDGDRYYYEGDKTLTPLEIAEIKATTLSQLIARNCPGIDIGNNVFVNL